MTFGSFGSQYVPSPAQELSTGVLFPSDRRPVMIVDSAPNAPAVDVTITSAVTLFSRLIAFWTFVPPNVGSWYVSCATTLPPSCFQRAWNAAVTFLK